MNKKERKNSNHHILCFKPSENFTYLGVSYLDKIVASNYDYAYVKYIENEYARHFFIFSSKYSLSTITTTVFTVRPSI